MNPGDHWKNAVRQSAVLNPVDRISEVLFGLIMVLTFTGAISASTDAREEVRELLWAALGCNIAWGLVDAIMYVMNVAIERGHARHVIEGLKASGAEQARNMLKEEIRPGIAGLMTDQELDAISQRIKALPTPATRHVLTLSDLVAGIEIFLLVFLCTFPVALPFGVIDDLALAMRVSNGIALLLLFVGGFLLARYAGFRRIPTALIYTVIGVVLVSITMALGG